ncbi:thioredoxin family protein [Thiohalorhabdus sp. Cl-TMA]|uniref:Thioredoxin family protein n=1 Tax=Thiohalorhabdus methylotrophus TaxID=3242694 RepID=A0ABV4TRY3_9GAMM
MRMRCTRPWKRFLALAFAALLMGAGPAQAERADPENFYNIVAFGDFQRNLKDALASGKKGMLVYFFQDQCPFCNKMEQEVFTRPIVHEFFHKYFDVYKVNIKGNKNFVDVDGDSVSQMKFAVQNRARATPTLIIFGKGGEELVRFITNPSVEEFLAMGKFVVEGAYKDGTDFFNYKRETGSGIEQEVRQEYL